MLNFSDAVMKVNKWYCDVNACSTIV